MNKLAQQFEERLVVLGFPCNQFGHQENCSEKEIPNLLKYVRPGKGYEALFPLFSKVAVNGKDAHPVFDYLKECLPFPDDKIMHLMQDCKLIMWSPVKRNDISWNFEKFLIDQNGVPFKRYSPQFQTKDIDDDIKHLLKQN